MQRNLITVIGTIAILYSCGVKTSRNTTLDALQHKRILSEKNLKRAMEIADNATTAYFTGDRTAMARYYNPYTGNRSDETGSVWMYTSVIESINAILRALEADREFGNGRLYDAHFSRYIDQLRQLYGNADYYLGTFTLTSYTGTNEWTVYGVHRAALKRKAKVDGIENVYDDQMWLVRELLDSYKVTGEEPYLELAEYLTAYVLDGWDCTLDENGNEIGGITWGPGYVTKHSCSNGPMISPLVWLHELYKDKEDEITHRYIDPDDRKTRKMAQVKKSDYYLTFAEKIYDWQKKHLLDEEGVYSDMMGGCTPGKPELEIIDGLPFRQGIICLERVGRPLSYNSGTMLSGAADLYRATGNRKYKDDGTALSDVAFAYFAEKNAEVEGYYSYNIDGFNSWFNGVLMRAYVDFYPAYQTVDKYIDTFQENLDHGYEHFLYNGILPTNLLTGWKADKDKNNTEGMFSFTFAAEYAVLARYELTRPVR
ncbi:MAG: glycoside hydrolase family 76 protein [Porphyromonadaceae bacterium]|nr:glycoside hydrolase family 76 protein [Porphyromonadaceae bacterium]